LLAFSRNFIAFSNQSFCSDAQLTHQSTNTGATMFIFLSFANSLHFFSWLSNQLPSDTCLSVDTRTYIIQLGEV
jgi:hypothetical protein